MRFNHDSEYITVNQFDGGWTGSTSYYYGYLSSGVLNWVGMESTEAGIKVSLVVKTKRYP